MDIYAESLKLHKENRGKLATLVKTPVNNRKDLSLAYTPGVAEPCRVIAKNPSAVYDYTLKQNTVAVISDGSAVLGLGNIGAEAAIPVMEGKCLLFKEFADVDAFPICLKTQDPKEIISIIRNIAPVFGGINLEDISAPRCFEIEDALQDLSIPVMHDDQHGTAVVVLAAVLNSLKVVGKQLDKVHIVVSGAGAAGMAITKMLHANSATHILLVDSKGIIHASRNDLNASKQAISKITNPDNVQGQLADAMKKADIFIGVSAPNIVTKAMVKSMAKGAIVIAMANPDPEIRYDDAIAAGAFVVGTGRSDFPNQVNNVLGFPGIFRGALDAKAVRITQEMKIAAAMALASSVEPAKHQILPNPLDKSVSLKVAEAVRAKAVEQGVVRKS